MKLLSILFLIPFLANIQPMQKKQFLFVGTYTSGESEGIYVYEFNPATGQFNHVSTAKGLSNPSFLTVAPDKKHLYAVSEFGKDRAGSVYAFSFNPAAGQLSLLNQQDGVGNGPCHISMDPAGKFAITGNYAGGSISVMPVRADGSVGPAAQTILHAGSSIVESRQKGPHVHSINFSPDGKQVFVPDLGTDKIMVYDFSEGHAIAPLRPASTPFVSVEPGGGPRHFTFSPNGQFAYVVHEISGKVTAFRYKNGTLLPLQTISGAPADYEGTVFSSADIHVSPDGRHLYMSNRGELNNISIFSINAQTGQLTLTGHQPSGGRHPRNFMIDPSGQYLLAANQNGNNIVVFRRDAATGLLTPTGQEIKVPNPVCLKMLTME
jgi:6-phosphogluconolactonase